MFKCCNTQNFSERKQLNINVEFVITDRYKQLGPVLQLVEPRLNRRIRPVKSVAEV